MDELSNEERKVIAEMIRGAWASWAVRSPEMASLLDNILAKMEAKEGGKEDGGVHE